MPLKKVGTLRSLWRLRHDEGATGHFGAFLMSNADWNCRMATRAYPVSFPVMISKCEIIRRKDERRAKTELEGVMPEYDSRVEWGRRIEENIVPTSISFLNEDDTQLSIV
eukprot:g65927.t1